MKNKILIFVFMAVGAVMLSTTNGFSKGSYGTAVNTACPPADPPYTGDCLLCHIESDKNVYTDAMDAYLAGGNTLTDFFCTTQPACNDSDADGYGNPGDSSCTNGSATDCNDNSRSINPGAAENCTDGIDNNCNNLVDAQDPNAINCPVECIDADGDGYDGNCSPVDCADNNPDVNPGAYEVCDDNTDNDCNGKADCADSACSGDPACVLEFCADYTDRGSCKADSRCNWSGKLKECFEPVVSNLQSECDAAGGRWNKKKETCTIR